MTDTTFESLLAGDAPVVIDGGLATQLEAQGHDLNHPLWSALLLQTNPQAIVDAHRAYLVAGAKLIITSSYQTNDPELVARSVDLAVQARDEFGRDAQVAEPTRLVAASIGPYGASLNDGSEYTGDYGVTAAQIEEFHAGRLSVLDDSAADLLACETIPSFDEAKVLAAMLAGVSKPAWICFSCRDGEQICDGTPIRAAAELFREHAHVQAVGINCTRPQYIESLIGQVRQAVPDKAVIVYPNSGEDYDAATKTWSGTVTVLDWAEAGRRWGDAGAKIIGGCCRTGPDHIRALNERS